MSHHTAPMSHPTTPMSHHVAPMSVDMQDTTKQPQKGNIDFVMICRKYGLPRVDFATPIDMRISKQNISNYSEKETTSYSPTKLHKTSLRKGMYVACK